MVKLTFLTNALGTIVGHLLPSKNL